MAPSNALSAEVYDTVIARAAGDAGISGAEADRVFQRLEQYKLDTVAGLAHFEFGLLRSESTRPAGLAKLKTLVTGPGASAVPSDSPELNTMLSSLADGIATAWLHPAPLIPGSPPLASSLGVVVPEPQPPDFWLKPV